MFEVLSGVLPLLVVLDGEEGERVFPMRQQAQRAAYGYAVQASAMIRLVIQDIRHREAEGVQEA